MSRNLFNSIRAKKPNRNVFDLGHERKFSMNMGQLVPILCQEVVPGDSFRVNTEMMLRFAPMLAPIMHRVNVYTHYFFVPNRLLWNQWEDFITGGEDGTSVPVFPTLNFNSRNMKKLLTVGSLADYMGIPVVPDNVTPVNGMAVNALPFRAYQLIYNEFYRDQNLQDPVAINLNSGVATLVETDELCTLRNRAWEKDYFTSALPWAQRGGEVTLPLSGDANVYYDSEVGSSQKLVSAEQGLPGPVATKGIASKLSTGGGESYLITQESLTETPDYVNIDPNGTLKADLSDVNSFTINELRRSAALQRWLERNARGGARYIEQILSHFGVRSSDARLQRPEYLGGGKSPVAISEVLQTSSTDSASPQANMAGHGMAVGRSHEFKKFFEEHGFIIGIMSVIPRSSYQQGLPRIFSKFDKFDYFFPEFAHLGEQEIKNRELYFSFENDGKNEDLFGYTPRYAEYKFIPGSVHGDFRTNLSFWHLGRIFSQRPNLNGDFVQVKPETLDRIFAVNDEAATNKLWIQIYNDVKAIRPMPKFGTPML